MNEEEDIRPLSWHDGFPLSKLTDSNGVVAKAYIYRTIFSSPFCFGLYGKVSYSFNLPVFDTLIRNQWISPYYVTSLSLSLFLESYHHLTVRLSHHRALFRENGDERCHLGEWLDMSAIEHGCNHRRGVVGWGGWDGRITKELNSDSWLLSCKRHTIQCSLNNKLFFWSSSVAMLSSVVWYFCRIEQ